MLSDWWPSRTSAKAAVAGTAIFLALLLTVTLAMPGTPPGDLATTAALHDWSQANDTRHGIWQAITRLGETTAIAIICGVLLIACLIRRRYSAAVWVVLCAATFPLFNRAVKEIVDRRRPLLSDAANSLDTGSFPSGHSGAAMTLAIAVFFVLGMAARGAWRWVCGMVAAALALLVGVSRMMLGVHYPSDVLAGWALSLVYVLCVAFLIARFSSSRPPYRSRPS